MKEQINMGCLITLILTVLISFVLIPTATSQDSAQLSKICNNNSTNYTTTYANNLKSLLDDLYSNTPRNGGFGKARHGEAYGLALCRGDVSSDYCDFCLYDARCKITQRCNKREAVVWYDYCYLKYSDYNFFGEIDNENKAYLYNTDNATDPVGFNKTARRLLNVVSRKAVNTGRLFASGHIYEKKENAAIYAMAQCSRDLSKANCTVCLKGAVKELPGFTSTSSPIGGRTLTGSCNVRYETYTFLINQPKKV